MSSYLTFYLSDKETGTKRCISSFSRSTEMYQEVDETLHVPSSFNTEGETSYTEITINDLRYLINEIDARIDNMEKSIERERNVSLRIGDCVSEAVARLGKSTMSPKQRKETVSDMIYELRDMMYENDSLNDDSIQFIHELTQVKNTLIGYMSIIASDCSDLDKLWCTIG